MEEKEGGGGAIDMFCCCSGMCALEKKVKVAHYGFGGNGGRQKPEIAMEGEREP